MSCCLKSSVLCFYQVMFCLFSNFPSRSVYAGLSKLLCCWNWITPPETRDAWECIRWIWMVLLLGLRLSSLTVYGFCSLYLGCSYQSERVHLNEGISCGMNEKLRFTMAIFNIFDIHIFPCLPIVFNFYFFVNISFYPENPFYLYTLLNAHLITLKFMWFTLEWFHLSNKPISVSV